MFQLLVDALVIIGLFLVVGKLADVVVDRARRLGGTLGIDVFFLGILLGFFTSTPEATIAVNAALWQVSHYSFGNLFGGTAVLLGLIAGAFAVRAGALVVREETSGLIAAAVYLVLPALLTLDGSLTKLDGVILVIGYLVTLGCVYVADPTRARTRPVEGGRAWSDLLVLLLGVAGIGACTNVIVRATVPIANAFGLSEVAVGFVVYAIGTNLPELLVVARAARKPDALPLATLMGSAIANPLLIGMLALISVGGVQLRTPYAMLVSYSALIACFFCFARTGRVLRRSEGTLLVFLYLLTTVLSMRVG